MNDKPRSVINVAFCFHQTFGVRSSVSREYIGILQFSDVIQADAQAHVVDHLRRSVYQDSVKQRRHITKLINKCFLCILHCKRNLVGQFLVEFLGYGFIDLSVEVPRSDPDSVDHLHQHKHDAISLLRRCSYRSGAVIRSSGRRLFQGIFSFSEQTSKAFSFHLL